MSKQFASAVCFARNYLCCSSSEFILVSFEDMTVLERFFMTWI